MMVASAEPPLSPSSELTEYERQRLRDYWQRSSAKWSQATVVWWAVEGAGFLAIIIGSAVLASGEQAGGAFVVIGLFLMLIGIPILVGAIPKGKRVSKRFLKWLDT